MSTFRFESTGKKAYKLVSFSLILTQLIFNTPIPQALAGGPSNIELPGAAIVPTQKGEESKVPRGQENVAVIPSGSIAEMEQASISEPAKRSTNPLEPLFDPKQLNTPNELNSTRIRTLIENGTISRDAVVTLLNTALQTLNTFMNTQFANGVYSVSVSPSEERSWMDINNSNTITNFDTLHLVNLLNNLPPPPPRQTITAQFVSATVDSGAYFEHAVGDFTNGQYHNYVEGAAFVNVPAGVTVDIRARLYMVSDTDESETLITEQVKGASSQNDANFIFKHTQAGTRYRIQYDIVSSNSSTTDYVGSASSEIQRTNGAYGFDASANGQLVGFYIQGYQSGGISPNMLVGQTFRSHFLLNINGQTAEPGNVHDMGNGTYQVIMPSNGYVDFDPATMTGRAEINFSIQQLVDKQCSAEVGSEGMTCRSTGPAMAYDIIDNRRVFTEVEQPQGVYNIETFNTSPSSMDVRAMPVGWPPDAFTINPATGKPSWAIRVTFFYNNFNDKKVFILNPADATGYHRGSMTGLPANTGGYMRVEIVDTRFLQSGAYVTPAVPIEHIYRPVSIVRVGPPADPWYRFVSTQAPTPVITTPVIRNNNGTIEIETTVQLRDQYGNLTKYVSDPPYRQVVIDYWPVGETSANQRRAFTPVLGADGVFKVSLTGMDVFDGTNYAFQILTDDRGIAGPTRVNGTFSTPTPVIGVPAVMRNVGTSMEIEVAITNLAAGREVMIEYWPTSPAGAPQTRTMILGADGKFRIELTGLTADMPYAYRIKTVHRGRVSATRETTIRTATLPGFSNFTVLNLEQQAYPGTYNMTGKISFKIDGLANLTLRPTDSITLRVTMPNQVFPGQTVTLVQDSVVNGVYTYRFSGLTFAAANLTAEVLLNGQPITSTLTKPPVVAFRVPPFDEYRPFFDSAIITTSGSTKTLTVTVNPASIPSWALGTELRFRTGSSNTTYTLTRTSPTSNTFSIVLTPAMGTGIFDIKMYMKVVNSPGTPFQNYAWIENGGALSVRYDTPWRQYKDPARNPGIESFTAVPTTNNRNMVLSLTLKNIPAGFTPTLTFEYYVNGVKKIATLTRSSTNPNLFTFTFPLPTSDPSLNSSWYIQLKLGGIDSRLGRAFNRNGPIV